MTSRAPRSPDDARIPPQALQIVAARPDDQSRAPDSRPGGPIGVVVSPVDSEAGAVGVGIRADDTLGGLRRLAEKEPVPPAGRELCVTLLKRLADRYGVHHDELRDQLGVIGGQPLRDVGTAVVADEREAIVAEQPHQRDAVAGHGALRVRRVIPRRPRLRRLAIAAEVGERRCGRPRAEARPDARWRAPVDAHAGGGQERRYRRSEHEARPPPRLPARGRILRTSRRRPKSSAGRRPRRHGRLPCPWPARPPTGARPHGRRSLGAAPSSQ